jgi:hypothetical protein
MALSKRQRQLVADLKAVSSICRIDYTAVEERFDAEWRTTILELIFRKIVTGYVIDSYTFIDEQLSDIICRIYFARPKNKINFKTLWRTKRFKSFVHNALDNLYPLQKMRLVSDIKEIPKEYRSTIERLNELRNALAHSFFPENRRSYRESKKVLYKGINIFSVQGVEAFDVDRQALVDYLWKRAHGKVPAHEE